MNARASELLSPYDNEVVDWDRVGPRLAEIGGRETRFDARSELPDVTGDIANADITPETPVTIRELRVLRTRIGDDIREALQSGPKARRQLSRLVQMRKELDESVRDQFGADSELVRNWDQFRNEYRERVVEKFDKGASRDATRTDAQGFYRTDDERVAELFYKTPAGLKQYEATFGNDGEAAQAMASVILDDLRLRTISDGRVNPGKLKMWAASNRELMERFPQVRAAVDDIGSLEGSIARRNATLDAREKTINTASLTRKARTAANGGDPNSFIQSATKNPALMRGLVRRLNEPEREALRKNIWETVLDQNPAAARELLEKRGSALSYLFEPQHIEDIRTIMDAREMMNRVPMSEGAAVRPNPAGDIEGAIGMPLTTLESRLFAAASGRTSIRYVAINLAGRMARSYGQADMDRVFREAIYDRGLARDLVKDAMFPAQKSSGGFRDRVANRLMGIGVRAQAASGDNEGEVN
jgi:hypothetical protein